MGCRLAERGLAESVPGQHNGGAEKKGDLCAYVSRETLKVSLLAGTSCVSL